MSLPLPTSPAHGRFMALPTLLTLLLMIGGGIGAHAQQGSTLYTWQQRVTPYQDIATPDSIISASSDDDVSYTGIPIKFPFLFNNQLVTRLSVSSNGFVVLGSGPIGSGFDEGYSRIGGAVFTAPFGVNNNALTPLNLDLRLQTGGTISINWRGTAPNRRTIIQFRNLQRFATGGDQINFQVILNEADRSIEYHYGSFVLSTAPPDRDAHVGIRFSATDLLTLISADMINYQRGSSPQDLVVFRNNRPPAGLVHRFSPMPPSPVNVGITNLQLPGLSSIGGCTGSPQQSVQVTVINAGTNPLDSARLTVRMGNTIRQRSLVFNPALGNLQTTVVTFSGAEGLDLSNFGTYNVVAYVSRVGDTVRINDTARTVITLAPGTVTPNLNTVIEGLTQARQEGWRTSYGRNRFPSDSVPLTPDWDGTFPSWEAIGAYVYTGRQDQYSYFYLPALIPQPNLGLRYTIAVTNEHFGNAPVTSVNDDTLSLVVSTDCGRTFRTIRRFSQADLTAGRIDNTQRTFIDQLPFVTGASLLIAFRLDNNRTVAPLNYRWHIDDIQFVAGTDMAVRRTRLDGVGLGCPGSAQTPVTVEVVNQGAQPVTSFTVGYRVAGQPDVSRVVTQTLVPGQSASFVFSGAEGLDLSANVSRLVIGFVTTPGDGRLLNDTASRRFTPLAISPLPTTTIMSFTEAETAGWRSSHGRRFPSDSIVNFSTNNWTGTFPSWEAIGAYVFANQADQYSYFYRPGYQIPVTTGMRFTLAVTVDHFGSAAITNIGNDTLSVLYSTNCGQSFVALRHFTQADLTAGLLDNTQRNFSVTIPGSASAPVLVAFRLSNGRTAAPADYRFHIDDIRFGNPFDIAVTSVAYPLVGTINRCPGEQVPLSVSVINRGFGTTDTIRVGVSVNGGPVQTTLVRQQLTSDVSANLHTSFTMPATDTARVVVSVSIPGDNNPTNDTIRVRYAAPRPQMLPSSAVLNTAQLVSLGWQRYQLNDGVTTVGGWGDLRTFGLITTIATTVPQTQGRVERKVASPPYTLTASTPILMTGRFAVTTNNTASPTRPIGLGQDTLYVQVRYNCGPWLAVRAFTQGSLDSNVINNTLQILNIPIPNFGAGQYEFAMMAVSRAGQQAPSINQWHFASLAISTATSTAPGISAPAALTLEPNPAHEGAVRVRLPSGAAAADLLVTDARGVAVARQRLAAGQTTATLDVSGLAPGVYTVRMTGRGAAPLVGRLVRQ